jgi:hypothetical protein
MKTIDPEKAKRACLSAKTPAAFVSRVQYRFGLFPAWPDWAKETFFTMRKESRPQKPQKRRAFKAPVSFFRKNERAVCYERAAGRCEICGGLLGEEHQLAHILEQSDRHRKYLGDYFVYSAANQVAVCGLGCNHAAELKGTGERYVFHLSEVSMYLSTHPDVPVGLTITDPASRRSWVVKTCL